MSQVLELAKQGDTSAIAALMNRSLAPQGIKARVLLEGQTLKVLLEGLEVPSQERFTNYTLQGLRKIGVATAILEIYGKQSDTQGFAWSQRFQVEGDNFTPVGQTAAANSFGSATTATDQATPSPPDATRPNLNHNLDLDPNNIQSLAKQGNIAAIEAFVQSALSDREGIESFVELQGNLLQVTIQTKQFLDGPAFCGEFGTKMNGLHGGMIQELAVYKRKSEKAAPFLMKKMTLFSAPSLASSPRPTAPPPVAETQSTRSNPEASSTTSPQEPAPSYNSEEITGLDAAAIQNLAKQGNLAAIAAFVKSVLSDREEIEAFVELQGHVLKVTIQTKQFLDGPAFCGELGTKLGAIASSTIREIEFYKRKNEKTSPFLMKKATIFHNPTPEPHRASSSNDLRPNGQSSAMSGSYQAPNHADSEPQEQPKLDPTRVVAAIAVLGALALFLCIQVPRMMARFGVFGYFALVMAIMPVFKFYRLWQPAIAYILTGK
jgi:hypothetical protein